MDWSSIPENSLWVHYSRFLELGAPRTVFLNNTRPHDRDSIALVAAAYRADKQLTLDLLQSKLRELGEERPAHLTLVFAYLCAVKEEDFNKQVRKMFVTLCTNSRTLFKFMQIYDEYGDTGRGRSIRRLISNFYTTADPVWLAGEAVKTKKAFGYSHRDILKLARPWTDNQDTLVVLDFMRGKLKREDIVRKASPEVASVLLDSMKPQKQSKSAPTPTPWLELDESIPVAAVVQFELRNLHWPGIVLPERRFSVFQSPAVLDAIVRGPKVCHTDDLVVLMIDNLDDEMSRTSVDRLLRTREANNRRTVVLLGDGTEVGDLSDSGLTLQVCGSNKQTARVIEKFNNFKTIVPIRMPM